MRFMYLVIGIMMLILGCFIAYNHAWGYPLYYFYSFGSYILGCFLLWLYDLEIGR